MPQATFVHEGMSIDYTPAADVAAGDVVVQGDLIGVAKTSLVANRPGALVVSGVFDFAKSTGSVISAGTLMYWNNTSAGSSGPSSGSGDSSGGSTSSAPPGFPCNCCPNGEKIAGFIMSASGIGNHNPNCNCAGMNVSAFVPALTDDGCQSAGNVLAGVVTCNPGGGAPGLMAWGIYCNATTVFVYGLFDFTQGQGEGIYVERSFPRGTSCRDMVVSGNDNASPPSTTNYCDYSSAILTMVPVVV